MENWLISDIHAVEINKNSLCFRVMDVRIPCQNKHSQHSRGPMWNQNQTVSSRGEIVAETLHST